MKKNVFLLYLMLCYAAASYAYDFEKDGIHYEIISSDNGTCAVSGSDKETISGYLYMSPYVSDGTKNYKVVALKDRCFERCTKLESIVLPNYVESIGSDAFCSCESLTSVSLGSELKEIGAWAFSGCNKLTSISIPESVKTIGSFAFPNSLEDVSITNLSAWCKIDFEDKYSNPTYRSHKLTLNDSEIKNLKVPNDITELKKHTFVNCSDIVMVTLPSNITSIGEGAFSGCSAISVISIAMGVKTIGRNAFADCKALTSITLPNSVVSIENEAFRGCIYEA